ncbi:ATP-dependent DNA ligase [Gordonia jinhuaensis]|uniref:Probable DNA ligase n=1 Tax=Gordonia jinhuaensis TaxID=1517702 RepID=A0A916TBK6_9ACTN|nr:ATP-dependent DNA ligase [Gordonia jinhuaensis]GGB37106.1 DNA ligase [Gordonia jinhuaensis]
MTLAAVVDTSAAVAATRSRTAKKAALSQLLRGARADELPVVVSWLTGELTQGRIGVGWRSLAAIDAAPTDGEQVDAGATTVKWVNAQLSELAAKSGAGSTRRRREILTALMGALTDRERQFVSRLLVGELRQGALEGLMVDAIAEATDAPPAAVRRAFMLSGSLAGTAAAAMDGAEALGGIGLVVGRPVRPMLASPADSLAAAADDLGAEIVAEYKLDGARIQVHRAGDEVHVFTRTLREITDSVPELVDVVRGLPCRSVILDGETLALTDAGRPRPFAETMSRFGSAEGDLLLHPFFFDCLHLDGVDLIDEPLARRLDVLEHLAPAHRMPAIRRPDAAQLQAHFDAAIDAGHEGVMVKDLASPYMAGRRGRAWQKVKPVHTLDLVVLGAEWGYGRRTGYLSNLHLGARDPHGGAPVMVGKTFKGLADALLAWQTEEFPRHESHRDSHTVYLRPELVVEIELDGVQRSPRYPGGVALRFARVLRYRPDKTALDADTIDTVRAMLVGQT